MKNSFIIILISFLTFVGNSVQGNPNKLVAANETLNDSTLLDFYRQYSAYTDPGEYEYLYENLPDSLPELCNLIQSQFIHQVGELSNYQNLIPRERWNESFKYPTVKSVLEGLLSYDSRGLVQDRKPEHRLVMGCRDYALLLASILKSRGIPTRLRYGHATYLIPDFHASHVICEVWNENDKRWMLVDPNLSMIDFSSDKFDFSNDAWLQMQNREIDPNQYGFPGKYSGFVSIVAKVCSDLASILGTEYTIFQYAPILDYAFENDNQLTAEQIEILNEISELMKLIDADNFSKLQDIYNNTPEIQITLSFEPTSINNSMNGEPSKLSNYSLSQNYPNPFNPNTKIEFTIPKKGNVNIKIYNTLGETVETLINDILPVGTHTIEFKANNLPSGVYYYSLEVDQFRHYKKMTLLK